MSTITKVALAGARGNIGGPVLDQLLKAGFQVTVLTREGGSATFPSAVTVKHVDYDSVESLTAALQGQDALVVTITTSAIGKEYNLIEASIKAGVKRFIPSEFGSDTFNEKLSKLPGYKAKVDIHEALRKAARESSLTWTSVVNGPFLDWGISASFLLNAKDRTIEYPDGGNHQFSATTLESIGKAVAGVLKNPEQTKNRPVYVQDVAITQRQLGDLVKKFVGADGWKETVSSIDEAVQQVWDEVKKAEPNPGPVFFGTLKAAIWGGDAYNSRFQKLDNELLGIKGLSPAELEAVVAKNIPK
ncbi:NAD(P)-binding protein [Hypoxylon rubiginosum]|uniref:NAD(P)-binding protein n=1 Tax=Hypoxylon rubiginosum TaxID=110542 RepID=A0ACB9YMJ4_9PEZI|nr:NAD(P)-binding protein [Hypoxylon rubiginosum]